MSQPWIHNVDDHNADESNFKFTNKSCDKQGIDLTSRSEKYDMKHTMGNQQVRWCVPLE